LTGGGDIIRTKIILPAAELKTCVLINASFGNYLSERRNPCGNLEEILDWGNTIHHLFMVFRIVPHVDYIPLIRIP